MVQSSNSRNSTGYDRVIKYEFNKITLRSRNLISFCSGKQPIASDASSVPINVGNSVVIVPSGID